MLQDLKKKKKITKIRLIIFYVAEDGEAVYSQQKQDLVLTVTHIISSS